MKKKKNALKNIVIVLLVGWFAYWFLCKWADILWLNELQAEKKEQRRIARIQKNCQDTIIEKDIVGISLNSDLTGGGSMGGRGFGFVFFALGNMSGDFSVDTDMNYYFYLKEDDGGLRLSQVSAKDSKIFEKDIKPDEAKIRYITEGRFEKTHCIVNNRIEFIIPKGTIAPFYNLIP